MIIHNPKNLKLCHNQTGKVYTFNAEYLDYDETKFTRLDNAQKSLFGDAEFKKLPV